MVEIPKETQTGKFLRIRVGVFELLFISFIFLIGGSRFSVCVQMKEMFPHLCLCKGEIKQIIGVGQVVQAAQAVILDLLQVVF